MSECPNEDRIDRYLMGRLAESETAELEEHYFNCSACFQKLSERNELVEAVRDRGAEFFEGQDGGIFPPDRWKEIPPTGFLPKVSWPVTAAAAAVLLAVVLVLIPTFKGRDFEIVSTGDEAVRGESLILISPRGEVKAAPAAFEWKAVGAAAEYRLALSGPETLWTTVTKATKADLADNVKRAMRPGPYQWQVKAYSAQGTLLAASLKTEFRIAD